MNLKLKEVWGKIKSNLRNLGYLHRWIVFSLDIVSFVVASFVTYLVYAIGVNGGNLSLGRLLLFLSLSLLSGALVFLTVRFYHIIIRHANLRDFPRIILSLLIAELLLYSSYYLILGGDIIPTIQYGVAFLFSFLITSFIIVGVRVVLAYLYYLIYNSHNGRNKQNKVNKILIYGNLKRSVSIFRQIQANYFDRYKPCGFIDPSVEKRGFQVDNLPVYGKNELESLPKAIERMGVQGILFSSNNSLQKEKENLVAYCIDAGLDLFVFDGIRATGENSLPFGKVRIEDLLNRPEIPIEVDSIATEMCGNTIMITGAAGSIGSELVRQLCNFSPAKIIMLDCAETPLHLIRLEIEEDWPNISIVPIIADVRHKSSCNDIVKEYRPAIIFHAAAYKHVPLMEENPCESVITNIMGTVNMAELARENGVAKFVMISTDKAVNPTNVMGATKRVAEMYVQSLDLMTKQSGNSGTQYITTRFGNVLGSNGSVVPRFRQQIEQGGPVTVTHPDIIRFFMTIAEACRLVLQAGTMGSGGEIFVFDMGEPVRIADMAKRMILLAGLKPEKDIKIVYTGLRPGEKLYEEVLSSVESTTETSHNKIRIAHAISNTFDVVRAQTVQLIETAHSRMKEDTVRGIKSIVPEFKSKNSPYERFDS